MGGHPTRTYVRSRIHLLKVPETEDPSEKFISEALGSIQLASTDADIHKNNIQDYIAALRRNPSRTELLKAEGLEQILHEYSCARPHLEAIKRYVFDNTYGDFNAYENRPRSPDSPPFSGDLTELVPSMTNPMTNPYKDSGSQLSSPNLAGLCLDDVLSAEGLPDRPKIELPSEKKGSDEVKIHSDTVQPTTGAVHKHPQGSVGGRYFLRPRDDTKALNKVCKIVQEQSVANFHGEEADVKVFDQKREKRNKLSVT